MEFGPGRPPGPPFEDGGPTIPQWMTGSGLGQLQILSLQAKEADRKLSPFIVGRSMKELVGDIDSANTEANGTKYVLRVRDPRQVTKLLAMEVLFDGTPVAVVMHPVLNTRRCVVSCREIVNETEEDLKNWLSEQGVVGVRRITRRDGENRVNTPTLILTINSTSVPEFIKIGPLRVRTRVYVPNPMLCYWCYAYRHTKLRCKNEPKCRNCSRVHSLEGDCTAAPFCQHCQGNHSPASRSCPAYQKEKEITRLRFTKNISHTEALKQFGAGGGSYADVSKLQQRLDNAREVESAKLQQKDEQIRQLMESIAVLTTRINEMEAKKKNKKQKKAKQQQKQQAYIQREDAEMEYDSSETEREDPALPVAAATAAASMAVTSNQQMVQQQNQQSKKNKRPMTSQNENVPSKKIDNQKTPPSKPTGTTPKQQPTNTNLQATTKTKPLIPANLEKARLQPTTKIQPDHQQRKYSTEDIEALLEKSRRIIADEYSN